MEWNSDSRPLLRDLSPKVHGDLHSDTRPKVPADIRAITHPKVHGEVRSDLRGNFPEGREKIFFAEVV